VFIRIIGTWVIKLIRGVLRTVNNLFVSIISRYVKLLTALLFYKSVFMITNHRLVVAATKRSIVL